MLIALAGVVAGAPAAACSSDETDRGQQTTTSGTHSGGSSTTTSTGGGAGTTSVGGSTSAGGSGGAAGQAGTGGGGPGAIPTDPELRVAIIGDQGLGITATAVLNLIKNEGAAFVLHQGDFDYDDNPDAWDAQITAVLGDAFPYFADVGNHDVPEWPSYQAKLQDRLSKVAGAVCTGDLGVKSECTYRGLHFILSGVGTLGTDHETYIHDVLANSEHIWRVCSWHKNQNDMQTGSKGDEVGWGAYQECQNGAALIVTGHEHNYSRTLTLNDLGNAANGHGATGGWDDMVVSPGSTFVVVSGVAGVALRDYVPALHDDDTWWSTIYCADYAMNDGVGSPAFNFLQGALFVDFYVDGDPFRARGYFKTSLGTIVDQFEIVRQ